MIEFLKFNFMRLYTKITGRGSPLKRRGGVVDKLQRISSASYFKKKKYLKRRSDFKNFCPNFLIILILKGIFSLSYFEEK